MWKFSTKTVDNAVDIVDKYCEICELPTHILCRKKWGEIVPANGSQTEVFEADKSVWTCIKVRF